MNAVLRLEGFGVAFGLRTVLREVSFSVPRQGCTVMLGPSGTGKSTLLRTLAGHNDANPSLSVWGRACYDGQPVAGSARPALVTQKPQMLVSSVQENLAADLAGRDRLGRAQQVERIASRLEQAGQRQLLDKLSMPLVDLPVHEQRMVAILRLALSEPALLMVDEPTANLADAPAHAIVQLLQRLADRVALLVVSHHLAQTRELASRVVLIADGVTQESASVGDFFTAPASEAARQFLHTGSCAETGALPLPPAPGQITARGPRGFVWLIEGQVAGTPCPGVMMDAEYDLEALRSAGITRLVSLTEIAFDAQLAARFGIRCAGSPIRDMGAPSLTQAWRLCQNLDAYCAAGEVVAVHCKAGLGRTGTVLAAYWIWRGAGRIGADAALAHVRGLQTGMVQTSEQVDFLRRFAAMVARPPPARRSPQPLSQSLHETTKEIRP